MTEQIEINKMLNQYYIIFGKLVNNDFSKKLNIIIVEDILNNNLNKEYIISKINELSNKNEKVCIIKYGMDIITLVPPISLEYKNDIIDFIKLYNGSSDCWKHYDVKDVLIQLKEMSIYNINKYKFNII